MKKDVNYYKNILLDESFGASVGRMLGRGLGHARNWARANPKKAIAIGAGTAIAGGAAYAMSGDEEETEEQRKERERQDRILTGDYDSEFDQFGNTDQKQRAPRRKSSGSSFTPIVSGGRAGTPNPAAADYGRRMQYGVGMEEPRSQYDLERTRMADRDIAAAKAEAGGNLGYQSRAQQLAGRVSRGYSGTLGANLEGDEKYDAYAGRLFTPPDAFKKELEKAKTNTATMRAELEAEDQYNRGERPSFTSERDSDLNIVRGGGNFGNLSSAEITQARMSAANRIMDRIKKESEERKRLNKPTTNANPPGSRYTPMGM
jgi:hypothetical protein